MIFAPTPIWGGFKGIIVNKKFNGSTTSDRVTTSSTITSTGTAMVTIGKGRCITSKHVPPLIKFVGLVVPTCWPCSNPKVEDVVAPVTFVLVLISTYTKVGGIYLKFGKAMW